MVNYFKSAAVYGLMAGGILCAGPSVLAQRQQAHAASTHADGKVISADGVPVAGASVRLIWLDAKKHVSHRLGPVVTDKNGVFDIATPSSIENVGSGILFATTDSSVGVRQWEMQPGEIVTVRPLTSVTVRAVDAAGEPVPRARLYLASLSHQDQWSEWDYSADSRWTRVTDAAGRATFPGLPQGMTVKFDVANPEFAALKWDAQVETAQSAATPEKTVKIEPARTISGVIRYEKTNAAAAGVSVSAQSTDNSGPGGQGLTDARGRFHIARIASGNYHLEVSLPPPIGADWIADSPEVSVERGKDASNVAVTLTHGALISGKVTDDKTGQPSKNVEVLVITGNVGRTGAMTGADGIYRMRVLPGSVTLQAFARGSQSNSPRTTVTVAGGEDKTVDFQCAAPMEPIVVHGIVRTEDGAPVAGADITAFGNEIGQDTVVSDDHGGFTFDRPGLQPQARIYARRGSLATTKSAAPPASGDLILTLSSHPLTVVRGTVTDKSGAPVPRAKITLYLDTKGQGGRGVGGAVADAAGRYVLENVFPDADYMVEAAKAGYAYHFSDEFHTQLDKAVDVPAITITAANSFVGGTIVDIHGNPIPKAVVQAQSVDGLQTTSDAHGRFHLAGVPRDTVSLTVTAPGNRNASVMVASGVDTNIVTVKSEEEQAEESKRFVALLDADKTNHGDGTDAHVLLLNAQQRAKADAKPILLVFHASWCGPCFLLHRFVEDPKAKPVLDAHFVVQDVDIWENDDKKKWENPGGVDIYKQYGGPNSVPYAVVLSADGAKLGDNMNKGENMGLPSQPSDIDAFLHTLRTAAPSLTDAEIATLRDGMTRASKI